MALYLFICGGFLHVVLSNAAKDLFLVATDVRCNKSSFIEDSLVKAASNGSVRHNQPPHLNFALVGDVVGDQSPRETHGLRQRRDRPYRTGLCASNVMQLA